MSFPGSRRLGHLHHRSQVFPRLGLRGRRGASGKSAAEPLGKLKSNPTHASPIQLASSLPNLMQELCSSQLARVCRLVWLPTLVFWLACPLFASLGEDVSSIRTDQAQLKTSIRVLSRQLYSVHEMTTASGSTIRQFVSPAGTVFAVTWSGFAPNLRQLLGSYFDQYFQAQATSRGRSFHMDDGDLVVDYGGHMRFVVGRAFLRGKVPSGVSADEIR